MTAALTQALREGLYLVLLLAAPPVAAVLLIGAAAGFLQTVTQVQDRAIATVPKVVAALLALAAAGPWILAQALAFMRAVLEAVPLVGRS